MTFQDSKENHQASFFLFQASATTANEGVLLAPSPYLTFKTSPPCISVCAPIPLFISNVKLTILTIITISPCYQGLPFLWFATWWPILFQVSKLNENHLKLIKDHFQASWSRFEKFDPVVMRAITAMLAKICMCCTTLQSHSIFS